MSAIGIVVVSHSAKIAQGINDLVSEVAKDVSLTFVGGTKEGGLGTSFDQVQEIVEQNTCPILLAFYDLGSAKMNLEMVSDFSDKEITVNHVPIVEGTYTAAALLQAGADLEAIMEQLNALMIRK